MFAYELYVAKTYRLTLVFHHKIRDLSEFLLVTLTQSEGTKEGIHSISLWHGKAWKGGHFQSQEHCRCASALGDGYLLKEVLVGEDK